jgi:hypothetical protein
VGDSLSINTRGAYLGIGVVIEGGAGGGIGITAGKVAETLRVGTGPTDCPPVEAGGIAMPILLAAGIDGRLVMGGPALIAEPELGVVEVERSAAGAFSPARLAPLETWRGARNPDLAALLRIGAVWGSIGCVEIVLVPVLCRLFMRR